MQRGRLAAVGPVLASVLALVLALVLLCWVVHRAVAPPGIVGRRWELGGDLAAAWLLSAAAVVLLFRVPVRLVVPLLVVGAVAVRVAALTPVTPTSNDVYRYAWDGQVQAAGISPYRYPPTAPELLPLRDPWLWPDPAGCAAIDLPPGCSRLNRPEARTIYPPVAQGWFRVLHELRPDGTRDRAYELAFLAVDLAVLALLLGLLRRREVRWAALYAWTPLPAVEAVANAHVDVLAALLAVAAVALVRARPVLAAVPLGLAVLVKLYPAVLVPLLLRSRRALAASAALLALVALVAAAYLPHVLAVGPDVLGYLPGYLAEERYDTGGRFLLVPLPGRLAVAGALAALAVGTLLVLRAGGSPEVVAARLVGVLLLVATPVQPWYALLLLALAAWSGEWWWAALGPAGQVYYLAVILTGPDPVLVGQASYGLAAVVVAVGLLSGARAKARRPSSGATAATNPSS